jgi:hypothetical protein
LAATHTPTLQGESHLLSKVGIVVERVNLVSAQVNDLVAGLLQISADLFLEGKPGVVGCDYQLHGALLRS